MDSGGRAMPVEPLDTSQAIEPRFHLLPPQRATGMQCGARQPPQGL